MKFLVIFVLLLSLFPAWALNPGTPTLHSGCESAFAKKHNLKCGGCQADEVCVELVYDQDDKASFRRKALEQVKNAVATNRITSDQSCQKAMSSLADEMTSLGFSNVPVLKNDSLRDKKTEKSLLIPFTLSAIMSSSNVTKGCQTCSDIIEKKLVDGRELAAQFEDLSPADVEKNINIISEGIEPLSCKKILNNKLRPLFKVRSKTQQSQAAATQRALNRAAQDAKDGLSGIPQAGLPGGKCLANSNAFGSGAATGSGEVTCQNMSEILHKEEDDSSGLCWISHDELYQFYTQKFLRNLNAFFQDSQASGRFKNKYTCSEEDILGKENQPTGTLDKKISIPCNACMRSTQILDLLSSQQDELSQSYQQSFYDFAQAHWCMAKLGYGETESGVACNEYIKKYQAGDLYKNVAREFGPEGLPALEQGLEEFETKGYADDAYKTGVRSLSNGAIRVVTSVNIPGLNRKVCMVGKNLDYQDSVGIKEGEKPVDSEGEESATWDRNFGQGATTALGHITGGALYDPLEKEVDCISLPARLVREALNKDGCHALDTIRSYIEKGLKHQGQGKLLVNTGLGAAIAIVAPGGYLSAALTSCGQAAFETNADLTDQERRQLRVKYREASELDQAVRDSQGSFSDQDVKRIQNHALGILKSCVTAAYKMGFYSRMSRYGNSALTKMGSTSVLAKAIVDNPALTLTIVDQVAKHEIDVTELISALPIDFKARNANHETFLDGLRVSARNNKTLTSNQRRELYKILTKLQKEGKSYVEFYENLILLEPLRLARDKSIELSLPKNVKDQWVKNSEKALQKPIKQGEGTSDLGAPKISEPNQKVFENPNKEMASTLGQTYEVLHDKNKFVSWMKETMTQASVLTMKKGSPEQIKELKENGKIDPAILRELLEAKSIKNGWGKLAVIANRSSYTKEEQAAMDRKYGDRMVWDCCSSEYDLQERVLKKNVVFTDEVFAGKDHGSLTHLMQTLYVADQVGVGKTTKMLQSFTKGAEGAEGYRDMFDSFSIGKNPANNETVIIENRLTSPEVVRQLIIEFGSDIP